MIMKYKYSMYGDWGLFCLAVVIILTETTGVELATSTSTTASESSRAESFESPLELLLTDRLPTALLSATNSPTERFEAFVALRSSPTRSIEFDARRFAPALLSRRALLASLGVHDVRIDVVDLVRLRWSSEPPSSSPVRVRINFERGEPYMCCSVFMYKLRDKSFIQWIFGIIVTEQYE